MKIFLSIKSSTGNYIENNYFEFNIETSYSPHNLWLITGIELEEEGIMSFHYDYKKVVAVMEVSTIINNEKFHGQVVSIAMGNRCEKLKNIIISLGEDKPEYTWKQIDNYYASIGEETYCIDLDELCTNKQYQGLDVEAIFDKLLRE